MGYIVLLFVFKSYFPPPMNLKLVWGRRDAEALVWAHSIEISSILQLTPFVFQQRLRLPFSCEQSSNRGFDPL